MAEPSTAGGWFRLTQGGEHLGCWHPDGAVEPIPDDGLERFEEGKAH